MSGTCDFHPCAEDFRSFQGSEPHFRPPRGTRKSRQAKSLCFKLPGQDSNLDKENQNLLCYRYTTGYKVLSLLKLRFSPPPVHILFATCHGYILTGIAYSLAQVRRTAHSTAGTGYRAIITGRWSSSTTGSLCANEIQNPRR